MTGLADRVQTWHHGVVAQWWAEFNTGGPEIEYYRSSVEQSGQPALDVACGTGRILLPLLRAGLDVDGCDVSSDMLALCRSRGASEGVPPRLYNQAMHELQIPRRFATVFVCGGFGLGGNLANDQEALQRFRRHLKPGGQLLLDIHVPFAAEGNWAYWREEQRRGLPQEWGPPPVRRACADGSELSLMSRVAHLDPLSQVITIDMRARRWRAGLLEADERYTLRERLYFCDELLMMLTHAGFHDIRVEGDYVHEVAGVGSTVLVFVAQAP